MHFSIPDTTEVTDENGAKYWNFLVHVNGVFHCKLRYSQLDKFYEQLRVEFPERTPGKIFPGKKIFSLSSEQLERRREGLESFIQHISQDPLISNSDLFNEFFLNAQRDGWDEPRDVDIEIYLMNGNKVTVVISTNAQTDDVFEIVSKKIGLNEFFFHYFALYLVQQDNDNDIKIVRRLQEFESPYLSLQAVDKPHKIVIRKNYCSSKYDDDIIDDRVAMNLLYVQIADDFHRGWMSCPDDIRKQMNELQAENSRKKFLRLGKKCKYYGFTHFSQSISDYPHANSEILVCCGEREFNTRVRTTTKQVQEGCFRVQRIRSWRLTSVPYTESSETTNKETLYFAFEYLFAKDDLRWITIESEQAIMMSMAMQAMVDEIIREQNGDGIRQYSRGRKRNNSQSSLNEKSATSKEMSTGKKCSNTNQPFAQNNKSSAFTWKNKKVNGVNEVFAHDIGDDDL